MTAITMFCKKDTNQFIGFSIKGHAGYSNYGNDIVCCAISTIAINVQNSIESFCEDCKFKQDVSKDGEMYFELLNSSHDTDVLLNSANLGFHEIAKQYKKFVTVKIKEV